MINFTNLNIKYNLKSKRKIRRWIKKVIKNNNKQPGELTFIFTDDKSLLKINIEYLNHNYYTDIITFDYCEGQIISGDIFISIDRIKENAIKYNETYNDELMRVIIHGILHLIGFDDHSETDKNEMRRQENISLKILNKNK